MKGLRIEQYTPMHAKEWDSLVDASRNGTFLHKRGYMDYHADRFADCSLMFYRGDEPVALLPAHIKKNCLLRYLVIIY